MTDPLFLLDSNICIYILTDAASRPTIRVQEQVPGRVVTSAIAAAEVFRGAALEEPSALLSALRFFELIPILPFDQDAARSFRAVPFRRDRFDRLIAAHALSRNLTLVTNNEADFTDIAGLRVENWTLP